MKSFLRSFASIFALIHISHVLSFSRERFFSNLSIYVEVFGFVAPYTSSLYAEHGIAFIRFPNSEAISLPISFSFLVRNQPSFSAEVGVGMDVISILPGLNLSNKP